MEQKSLSLYRPSEYIEYAQADLMPEDVKTLTEYLAEGGHSLAPETAAKFFELFLNGSDAKEIQKLNKAFPLGSILDAQIKYRWSEKRDAYASDLQDRVVAKVKKAQLETTELMTDMLVAARKKYGDKLKKFIQTGNEEDLDGVLNIESLNGLMKITEGLLKVTGQDRTTKVETKSTQNVNVNVNSGQTGDLSPEDAAEILNIMSKAKRRSNNAGNS
jgi:hypothetical protein